MKINREPFKPYNYSVGETFHSQGRLSPRFARTSNKSNTKFKVKPVKVGAVDVYDIIMQMILLLTFFSFYYSWSSASEASPEIKQSVSSQMLEFNRLYNINTVQTQRGENNVLSCYGPFLDQLVLSSDFKLRILTFFSEF